MARDFSHGASALSRLSRVTLARSQRQGHLDTANWLSYVSENGGGVRVVSCRVVSHCITLRGAAPAIVLPHEQLPTAWQRTAQLSSTAMPYSQQNRALVALRQCGQWPSVLTLTPCVSPGFKGSQAGGAAAEPSLGRTVPRCCASETCHE